MRSHCAAAFQLGWLSFLRLLLFFVFVLWLATSLPGSAGQERYDYDPIGRLIRYVDSNGQITEYNYDAAGNITSVLRGGTAAAYVPSISGITPNFVRRGETRAIAINGQRLQVGALRAIDSELDLANVRQAANQINANLTVGTAAALGTQSLVFSNAEGVATTNLVVGPELPLLSLEPSPLALPPNNTVHAVTLRLSGSDVMAHNISISSTNPAKVSVSPGMITIVAGQTSAQINVTSISAGFANLVLTSSALKSITVPVFVTTDFRGVNTSYATAVGVVVGSTQTTSLSTVSANFTSARVGLAVGSVVTEMSPKALPLGSSSTLVINGFNIPVGSTVAMAASSGISLGVSTVSGDGKQMSLPISIDANASPGTRRVTVRDNVGNVLPFSDVTGSVFTLTTGQPEISSVSPLYASAGTRPTLFIRGTHLQNAQVRILPDTDLRLDSQPSINPGGTEISFPVQIGSLAATGRRVVQVITPSGQTPASAGNSNQWTIVSEIKSDVTPIMAASVGVVLGSVTSASNTLTITPLIARNVGVVLGSHAFDIQPHVAVVGTTSVFTITGQGLQAVQLISSLDSTGLTIGSPTISSDGSQLSVVIATDMNAPKTQRRIILNTANGRIDFADSSRANIVVSSPAPEVISIAPQVIPAGQARTVTVRGRNFRDIQSIRFDPDQGLGATSSMQANADGTELSVALNAASNASSGARTMIVVSAGGQSSIVPSPANTVYVAQQTGATYEAIMAQSVGVLVGTSSTQVTQSLAAYAPVVGVQVESILTQQTASQSSYAKNVGVVLGSYITGMSPLSPDGILKGSTSTLLITGAGLEQVTSVQLVGSPSISVGGFSANPNGLQVSIPVSVPVAGSSTIYAVRLYAGSGTDTARITSINYLQGESFSTGAMPQSIDSVSPIVLEQGKIYTLNVRGSGLRDVFQVVVEPSTGVIFGEDSSTVLWTADSFGEKLAVRLRVEATAPIGSRVIRLKVPGGITNATPIPANTITIVQPQ